MKHKNRILALILAGAAIVGTLSGCGGSASEAGSASASGSGESSGEYKVVNIGFPVGTGDTWCNGPLAVANEYGYLDEYLNPLGYTAEITGFTGAAPAIHEALVSKDLDFAYYAGFAGIAAKSNGIDAKLLAVPIYDSLWQLAVTTDSGINSIEDLKGKKFAYTRGASPQMYALRILEEAGLSQDDVEIINSTVPEALSSLASGAVDAAVVSFGQADQLVDEGTVKIAHQGADDTDGTYLEPYVFTGRTEYIEENPEVAEAIIKAMLKGRDKILEDVDAFRELTSERSGYPLESVIEMALDDTELEYPVNLDDTYIESLKSIEEFELKYEIIPSEVNFDDWIDSSYLDKAAEEYNAEKGE